MFTGIVETTGKVLERTNRGIRIERPAAFTDLAIGGSISVAGVCLSLTGIDPMTFDIVPETFARTTLGRVKAGDHVNLERSLSASGRFEGHVVQGHVEGVGTVVDVPTSDNAWCLTLAIPPPLLPCVIHKGSIAIDGVSLTVAAVTDDRCTVALIPHTLAITTLGHLRLGDGVNIETDVFLRALAAWDARR